MVFVFFCQFEELGQVERVVLCIVLFELSKCDDVFYKVVINEVIEFVKMFGVVDSYKFVNGVLDKVVLMVCK